MKELRLTLMLNGVSRAWRLPVSTLALPEGAVPTAHASRLSHNLVCELIRRCKKMTDRNARTAARTAARRISKRNQMRTYAKKHPKWGSQGVYTQLETKQSHLHHTQWCQGHSFAICFLTYSR